MEREITYVNAAGFYSKPPSTFDSGDAVSKSSSMTMGLEFERKGRELLFPAVASASRPPFDSAAAVVADGSESGSVTKRRGARLPVARISARSSRHLRLTSGLTPYANALARDW